MNAIYLQTNDAEQNEVIAFRRDADGTLTRLELVGYKQALAATGKPHLASQSSDPRERRGAFVVNAGSEACPLFARDRRRRGLACRSRRVGRDDADGVRRPRRARVRAERRRRRERHRLHARGRKLAPSDDTRALAGADPAQIRFTPHGSTLVVTDRANTRSSRCRSREATRAASVSGATPLRIRPHANGSSSSPRLRRTVGAAAASSHRVPARAGEQEHREYAQRGWPAASTRMGVSSSSRPSATERSPATRSAPDGSLELVDPVAGSTVLAQGRAGRGPECGRPLPLRAGRRRAPLFAFASRGRPARPVGDSTACP